MNQTFLPTEVDIYFRITKFYTMFEDNFFSGYSFSGESHDFWECVYVKRGNISICASDHIYNLGEGDIIFHKPLEFHRYNILEGDSADLFIFSFQFEGENVSFFEDKVFSLNKHQRLIITQLLNFLHEKEGIPPFKEMCQKNSQYITTISQSLKSSLYISIIANYVCSLLYSICDTNILINEADISHSDIFKKAVKYMTENICEKLTLNDISKFCATSTTSLKSSFLEFAGIGVHKYFLKMKINRAISLLTDGHSVNEAASLLGFSSQAYFSAAFKRETGISPSKYNNHSM